MRVPYRAQRTLPDVSLQPEPKAIGRLRARELKSSLTNKRRHDTETAYTPHAQGPVTVPIRDRRVQVVHWHGNDGHLLTDRPQTLARPVEMSGSQSGGSALCWMLTSLVIHPSVVGDSQRYAYTPLASEAKCQHMRITHRRQAARLFSSRVRER